MINNSVKVTATKGSIKKTFMSMREASRELGVGRKAIKNNRMVKGWLLTYVPSQRELLNNPTQAAVEGASELGEQMMMSKILLLDIETAPSKGYFWRAWKENISPKQILTDWFIISWAAKWLYEEDIMSDCLTPKEMIMQDDKRIMESMWELLNECNVVVSHNGDRFDIPKLNTRFLMNGLQPYSPVQSIDTCTSAKKYFSFTHNKLDYLCQQLGIGNKVDTGGFELWSSCMDGDKESLAHMEEYNGHDVVLLEGLYLKLRPWIKSHPNLAIYVEKDGIICPYCGGDKLEFDGSYDTQVSSFPALRCKSCGGIARTRGSSVTIKKRRSLLVSCAR